jgi:ferric-dicitrate binding protein FerR (iron transport regulator)
LYGTRVWLNAESSITFPTAFKGNERIVKLPGEAYFEVRHDAAHPFKVQTPKQTIEDIGTSFDVNAYNDEPATKTTLIQGSVMLSVCWLRFSHKHSREGN